MVLNFTFIWLGILLKFICKFNNAKFHLYFDRSSINYRLHDAFRGMLLGIACITWGIILIVKK